MSRTKKDGKTTTESDRATEPSIPAANAGDHTFIPEAIANAADAAANDGRPRQRGVLEALAEGRRRIAEGEKVIVVIRGIIAEFPGMDAGIATALAPTHAYGPGKAHANASQWGKAMASSLRQVTRPRARRLTMDELRKRAEGGDIEAAEKLEKNRRASIANARRRAATGKRAATLKKYQEKLKARKQPPTNQEPAP